MGNNHKKSFEQKQRFSPKRRRLNTRVRGGLGGELWSRGTHRAIVFKNNTRDKVWRETILLRHGQNRWGNGDRTGPGVSKTGGGDHRAG